MTDAQLTVCDALFEDPANAPTLLEQAITEYGLLASPPEGTPKLASVAMQFVTAEVVEQVVALLRRLPLADMLADGWSQLQKVVEAQAATRQDHSSRNVSVLEHELTVTQEPTVEMLVDELPVPVLSISLELVFGVAGCNVVVTAGEIADIEPGPIGVTATLRSANRTLFEHTIAHVDPARILIAGSTSTTPTVP